MATHLVANVRLRTEDEPLAHIRQHALRRGPQTRSGIVVPAPQLIVQHLTLRTIPVEAVSVSGRVLPKLSARGRNPTPRERAEDTQP